MALNNVEIIAETQLHFQMTFSLSSSAMVDYHLTSVYSFCCIFLQELVASSTSFPFPPLDPMDTTPIWVCAVQCSVMMVCAWNHLFAE